MHRSIFHLIGIFLLAVLVFLTVYVIVKTLAIIIRCRFRNIRINLRDTRYINLIEFVKWVIIDFKRGKDYFKLFGIWAFTGYYGQGKSLGCVNFAFNLQEKYPHKDIKIFSNFNVDGQVGKIEKWQDLLDLPKNSIVIFDEIQSTFTSQKYKDFPLELLWKLTQCRKHGLAIFCTSPVYNRMTIQLRESTDYVIQCKNVFKLDRMFIYDFYHADDFESYINNASSIMDNFKKRQFRAFRYTLVSQDMNYARYNTEEQITRWDIEDVDETKKGSKKISQYDYNRLKNDIIKEIEKRMKIA